MIKSVLALKISLIKYVLMCCLLLSNFVALAQTATMKLTFDVSHLFVPNYKGEGLNGENVLDLRYHFRIDIYKNDALIETGLPEKILDFSIPVDKKNEWYPFHEIPDVSNDGPNKMIFSRIIEFDPNAEYKARVYFRLEEYDNDGAIDKGIWICGSDGGYDEWDKKQFDFTSYFNELICNSYHEPNINTTDFIGGCRNTYNDEHPQNLLFGQRGYYQLDFTAEIFHIDLPTEETVCSNELTEGISIVDLMNPFVSGYDRRLNLYNPVEGGPEEEETNGYAFDIIEGFGGLPWPSSWVTAMRWKGIDNDNDDFLYLSYNTINGTSSFGEPKITLPGNYQLEVGYISYPTIMHINSNFSIGGNYEFFPSQTQTVEIIANPSPVIDHVLDAYFICPGEVLTLGEDYEPVGENLLVTENYPNPPPPAGSVFPSPNENQSEGLEVDGLDFTWFKTHNAEGDDIQDICMGYTPTMEIEEPGQYLLTIEHHYYHPFSSQYNSCISTHPFVVTYGPGPDIVLPPYVEMCPQNLNNDGTIDLNASVCLTSCDPNAIAETNGYHFEWSRGGVILNPIEVPQDPADPITYADMPTYAANTPGIYIVKATNNITQCFSYKQIEVIACNEQNFDKIVPLSLVNVLENIDSDGSGDNDIEATATLTVADPTDCSISEPIERKALVKLNYHRGQHTDIEGADDWVLMVEYEINGVPAESPLIINNIGGQPTYLAVNEHLLDPCDDQVVILEVVSVQAFDGSIANSPNAITMDDLPADIHLELEQKIYRLSPLSSLVPLLSVGNIDINQKVQIDWTEVEGALEYELMIAFEDEFMEPSQKLSGSGNVSEDAFFRNYGYKIETNNNSYVLDVTYPEGNLFFRVRPIGRHVGPDVQGNYSFRDYGDWSVYQTLSVEGFHGATNLKSWQKTIIFAEDSKHKEVVSYFDNLMRNEGVVTHLNSDGTVLRAHTFYDHEGRPTLQTLPFAEIGSSLEFEAHQYMAEGESTLLSAKDFDFGIQPQLETNYGSANYYSPASEMLTPDLMVRFPNLEFIPNANGFVTTQSVFKNDGTGRIIRQSGVGETFSLKAPNLEHHETRYYYATATSSELHRLFGSNVGNPNHYKKQAVLDPNGQVSVSYLDMQDRVIATALSGETPDNLVSLANVPENFTLQMDERNIWDAEQNAFILEHEILNTVEDTDYEFKYDISTIVNSLSYIFPGQQNVFEQEYSEVPDDGWAASNNWQITNGTAILDNGYLLFQNEQSNLGGFTATLTLDIPEVNNTSEYIVLAQFKDVVYPPVVEFSTDQSTFQPIVLSENQKLFHVFNASNTVQPQLRITFPDAITYGELASLDFVKVYEKQFVPILYSNLNFEGSTIEEDGNNTSTVTWTTNDVVQISTSNDVAEFIERIGDEANDPNDSDFEATLSIVFPASNVDRNFELVFNASFYDPVTDLHFYIEDVDQGEVKVLNFGEFTIGASTSTTVDFKWEADNLNHLPNTFSKKLMELNYFKIFEIVDGEQVDIFKICAACEYDFTTYIIDENGNKVPLTAVNVIDDVDEPALDINATITKDGFDCNGVTPPTLVGENLFDIKIGSESIADANFTAIDENLDVLGSNNVYPELTFEANLPNIGTYKVYKKLALNNNSVSVALESNKAILQEGYIYQYIKDQAQIVDLDALCTFTCEDACAASVVALINDNLGLDYFDADRIKIADLYDALANVDHPDYVEWTELFDNCKEENFCDDPVAIMPEYQSGLSAELACEGMLGQMKNQISEPREFYGDIANNEDITDQERSDQYFAFLYEDYTNFELESLGGMLVDEINIDNNIIATDNIRNWVDAIFGMLSSVGNTPDNPFGVDFQTTQNNEVVKGEFILNHWNGTLTTNEKDFLLANYNTQNNTNYTTYDELLEENAVNPLNYTLPDDITDWEDIYMVFHREYIHYLYCKNDVDGRAYMTNLRVEPTTWSAAQTSGHLYPLSNDAATIVGSYNGGNINIGNLSESSKDPLFDTEPFSGLINEFLGNNYLSSYKKISNENELINLWQFLDEQGEYGCILYGVTEDLNYDDDYFEIPGNQANFPPAWNNCWPSVPGFQHASGEVLGQMKWQKFVNFYSGQREKLKASVFENSGGTYFDDAFAINVKPDDGTEESFNEAQNTYPVEMCESQCVSNVATWIDGLKAYCEAQAIEYYQNNTTPPAPSVLDDEIAANNLAIDGIADELSSICLDNCQFNQLTAYLTQEDLDQTTDPLYVLLNGLNILYINDALVAYVALPEAEKTRTLFRATIYYQSNRCRYNG